ASMLIREKGFKALARPLGKIDEVIIAVPADAPVNRVEDLKRGIRLVFTDDPNVHLVGMIMLEPANLSTENIQSQMVDSYAIVAKQLIRGEADAGIFLKEAFDDLSNLTRSELKPLVESQINDIFHALLVGPHLAAKSETIRSLLINMNETSQGKSTLDALGIDGWASVDEEDAEFMIDLMDAIQ
ncbi:MAG TPA: phosphate ABC transporter substrate-binding protein, partial [Anaerolineales bacterium]|nr:phosphate ABC transporter substrate-binding protein [Anaerolineales bacterium]